MFLDTNDIMIKKEERCLARCLLGNCIATFDTSIYRTGFSIIKYKERVNRSIDE